MSNIRESLEKLTLLNEEKVEHLESSETHRIVQVRDNSGEVVPYFFVVPLQTSAGVSLSNDDVYNAISDTIQRAQEGDESLLNNFHPTREEAKEKLESL